MKDKLLCWIVGHNYHAAASDLFMTVAIDVCIRCGKRRFKRK